MQRLAVSAFGRAFQSVADEPAFEDQVARVLLVLHRDSEDQFAAFIFDLRADYQSLKSSLQDEAATLLAEIARLESKAAPASKGVRS